MPFFMGVSVAETLEAEGNANLISSILDTLGSGLEPYINLSMLSGIRDTIEATRYSDADDIAKSIATNIISSYFSQLFPTIGTKIGNLVDPTRRSNYIDKTSAVPEFVQSALNTIYSKVPGLSYYKSKYIDAWGNEQYKGGVTQRFFQNFLSPGYLSDVNVTEIDEELKRLSNETGAQSVLPDSAKKYFKFKNYRKDLSADDYEVYAVNKGQLSADYINEFIRSKEYKKLTDEEKVKVIENLYTYADKKAKAKLSYSYEEVNLMYDGGITASKWISYSAKTKKALVEEYLFKNSKKANQYERNGGSVIDYYIQQVNK
jgi:hypothetical protein